MPKLLEMYSLLLSLLSFDLQLHLLSSHSGYLDFSLLYFLLNDFDCDIVFSFDIGVIWTEVT
jgi:hypothetical protein